MPFSPARSALSWMLFSSIPLLATCRWCRGHVCIVWGCGPHSWSWNSWARTEECASFDWAPHPSPVWIQMAFDVLKRRISRDCILQQPSCTLFLSTQGWSLASSHCLTSETLSLGSSWMPPLSRRAARTQESVLRAGSSVPRNPSNNLIASGLCWAHPLTRALWVAKHTDEEEHSLFSKSDAFSARVFTENWGFKEPSTPKRIWQKGGENQ